jgi:hypothetical protein
MPKFACTKLKKTVKASHDNRSPGRDSNPSPREYEAGFLTTWQRPLISSSQINVQEVKCKDTKDAVIILVNITWGETMWNKCDYVNVTNVQQKIRDFQFFPKIGESVKSEVVRWMMGIPESYSAFCWHICTSCTVLTGYISDDNSWHVLIAI